MNIVCEISTSRNDIFTERRSQLKTAILTASSYLISVNFWQCGHCDACGDRPIIVGPGVVYSNKNNVVKENLRQSVTVLFLGYGTFIDSGVATRGLTLCVRPLAHMLMHILIDFDLRLYFILIYDVEHITRELHMVMADCACIIYRQNMCSFTIELGGMGEPHKVLGVMT